MNTFTIKTSDDTTVTVTVTEEAIIASKEAALESLLSKIAKMKEQATALVSQSNYAWAEDELKAVLAAKAKKDELLSLEYSWDELFTVKANTRSLSGFLTSKGLDKSLHGSCNRAHNIGKAVLAALLPNALPYAVIRAALINAIGGKEALWQPMLLEFMGYLAEEESASE
jgi:hypothetical protein